MATKSVSGLNPVQVFGVGYRAVSTAISLLAIWVAAAVAAIYSPDMITGSNHEHMQLAMLIVWPLAAVSTGMVLLAAGVSRHDYAAAGAWSVYAFVTTLAWVGAAVASVFVSPMVTGTDPTTIPVAAMIAPLFALLVTAYGSIYVAGAGSGES